MIKIIDFLPSNCFGKKPGKLDLWKNVPLCSLLNPWQSLLDQSFVFILLVFIQKKIFPTWNVTFGFAPMKVYKILAFLDFSLKCFGLFPSFYCVLSSFIFKLLTNSIYNSYIIIMNDCKYRGILKFYVVISWYSYNIFKHLIVYHTKSSFFYGFTFCLLVICTYILKSSAENALMLWSLKSIISN